MGTRYIRYMKHHETIDSHLHHHTFKQFEHVEVLVLFSSVNSSIVKKKEISYRHSSNEFRFNHRLT